MDLDDDGQTEVFELASNETRMDVLWALANAFGESPADPWVDYSDLREAAGVRDKGNFNYHLDRLDGLVVKERAGYRLSATGMQLVSAVASRGLDPAWTWGPVDVPGDCVRCGESLSLRYAHGSLRLECGADEHTRYLPGRPSLLEDHSEESVAEHVAVLLSREVSLVRRGVCPACEGALDGRIRSGDDTAVDHRHYHGSCRRCWFQSGFTVGTSVLPHPALVAFFHERGVDVRERPFWTLPFCRPGAETVVSEDPLRVRVDVDRDGDSLSLTLDREAGVVAVDRPGTG